MAADERLFAPQIAAFPNMRVVAWIPPQKHESLPDYAARLARSVDPDEPCIVGGASFGGAVALEMATHLQSRGCILIGGLRSTSGIPWRWRIFRFLVTFGPDVLQRMALVGARLGRPLVSRGTIRRLERLSRPESGFARWAMCAILTWRPSPATRQIRIIQIHGSADRVLPCCLASADEVVPGGPHALTLFRSNEVNAFIERSIRAIS